MTVFGLAIMLLITLTSLRTSLIDEWQLQLPPEAPNHFLLNIAPHEVAPIEALIAEKSFVAQPMYPMIRGRVTHLNGVEPSAEAREKAGPWRYEVNLSWAEQLGSDNQIVKGVWWDQWYEHGVQGVSVEEEIAQRMGVKLGDDLRFNIGGLEFEARVASIRKLEWDSMKPNFYFMLSPGALDGMSPTYLTSVYLPPGQKLFINDLLLDYPTVLVIEMDRVIAQIQSIVSQVSGGVELMLWLVLIGGFLVMWAAVSASMDERKQETGLLRALGCTRNRLLGALFLEFSLLGFCAGVMAAVGSEALLMSIQRWMFEMPLSLHPQAWLWGVSSATLLIGVMGVVACRKVVTTPPGITLRETA